MNDQRAVKDMHPRLTNEGTTGYCLLCEQVGRERDELKRQLQVWHQVAQEREEKLIVAEEALEYYSNPLIYEHMFIWSESNQALEAMGNRENVFEGDRGIRARKALSKIRGEK